MTDSNQVKINLVAYSDDDSSTSSTMESPCASDKDMTRIDNPVVTDPLPQSNIIPLQVQGPENGGQINSFHAVEATSEQVDKESPELVTKADEFVQPELDDVQITKETQNSDLVWTLPLIPENQSRMERKEEDWSSQATYGSSERDVPSLSGMSPRSVSTTDVGDACIEDIKDVMQVDELAEDAAAEGHDEPVEDIQESALHDELPENPTFREESEETMDNDEGAMDVTGDSKSFQPVDISSSCAMDGMRNTLEESEEAMESDQEPTEGKSESQMNQSAVSISVEDSSLNNLTDASKVSHVNKTFMGTLYTDDSNALSEFPKFSKNNGDEENLVEDTSRSSIENSFQDFTEEPSHPCSPFEVQPPPRSAILPDEDSQGSSLSQRVKKPRNMEIDVFYQGPKQKVFTADAIYMYQWPPGDPRSEFFVLQEHIGEFLGITSFKRRYPKLFRRQLECVEKTFLLDRRVVTEQQGNLGLTALKQEEVLDILSADFPDKFQEVMKVIQERKRKTLAEKQALGPPAFLPILPTLPLGISDKGKMEDNAKRAVRAAAEWNAHFNRERREERRAFLDLQTYTVHHPVNKYKRANKEDTKMGLYPIALVPGQFCDNYKMYTPAELKYMPLNTVLYGPMQKPDSEGEEEDNRSQSDSEDSSSDDSSSSSQEGSDETGSAKGDGMKTESDELEEPETGGPKCKVCSGTRHHNKLGKPEELVTCASCEQSGHVSCLDLMPEILAKVTSYEWQCMECKTCVLCKDAEDEDKMMFCDLCDRGYHIYCIGLRKVPGGRWHCVECAICDSCGTRNAGGSDEERLANWQHEACPLLSFMIP
ncbi:unnamed protein product [Darwinula stevensoni]|uniref:PHD finger protein 10 n=1 Tax=Darwinula stevensoni TaxID=69355 RepID=A0A7R8X788_9CRUS|nr:unnamed protein product [Darwinula stevensoni]CAG0886715.1 unnamed protein product [Darwinula stevensoni]